MADRYKATAQLCTDAHQALDVARAAVLAVPPSILLLGVGLVCVTALVLYALVDTFIWLAVPSITVPVTKEEDSDDVLEISTITKDQKFPANQIPCYDPSTMQLLGVMPAMTKAEVVERVERARAASKVWKSSTFKQRKLLLRILLKYIVEHQATICKVSARDSGKVLLDAALSEIVVTCEKILWLLKDGQKFLKPDIRTAGILPFYKTARVEYHPLGVIGCIVPWNHPFHNVLNPLTAAIFTGNAIVIKVSEHACWSASYYGRIITAALAAAKAPADLVQLVTGYGEAGQALVSSNIDKIVFVGSTQVGRKVMVAAADRLTPITLELGGKDPVIVADDADLGTVLPIACKAAFFAQGQNCAGGERFLVQDRVYDRFVQEAAKVAASMRFGGPTVGGPTQDLGAMCMPGLAEKVQQLVDDAVAKGGRVLAGGKLPQGLVGQFYPPTVLVDVTRNMRIWQEEVFGPVMVVVRWSSDDEAVALANDCAFGLGSNVFSSPARARRMGERIEAGMLSINDFASTYPCQSLPFGGVKESGFGRFAGVEGLRALCVPKAVCEDAVPWLMSTALPPPWHYPVKDVAFDFATGLVRMFYGPSMLHQLGGLLKVAACFLLPAKKPKAKAQ